MRGLEKSKEQWLRLGIKLFILSIAFSLFLIGNSEMFSKETTAYIVLGTLFVLLIGIVLLSIADTYNKIAKFLAKRDTPTFRSMAIYLEEFVMHGKEPVIDSYNYTDSNLTLFIDSEENYVQFVKHFDFRGNSSYRIKLFYHGKEIKNQQVELYHKIQFEQEFPGLSALIATRLQEINEDIQLFQRQKAIQEEKEKQKIEKSKQALRIQLTKEKRA